MAFVAIGAIVLLITKEGKRHAMPFGLAYSLDLLLPVIKLRALHYAIDLRGPARYYFYFHQLVGYVLAAALIAEVGGFTG